MRAKMCFNRRFSGLTPLLLAVALGKTAFAQTYSNNVPIISVQATDPRATWSGDTGTFTIFRAGPTNQPVPVFFGLSGTASNGVDYASIPNSVTLDSGVIATSIVVKPINNGQTDIRTVTLEVLPSPLA